MACKFVKNDYLADKCTKELFFVVRVRDKEVMLRNEKDDSVEEVAVHFCNRVYEKVDPATYELLYKNEEEQEKT